MGNNSGLNHDDGGDGGKMTKIEICKCIILKVLRRNRSNSVVCVCVCIGGERERERKGERF